MKRQWIIRIMCLAVAVSLLSFAGFATGEQASLEALLDDGTTIETIESGQENASDAKAILNHNGQYAVAAFAQVNGTRTSLCAEREESRFVFYQGNLKNQFARFKVFVISRV